MKHTVNEKVLVCCCLLSNIKKNKKLEKHVEL